MVAALETALPSSDIEEARAYLRGMLGSIKVESDAKEIRFVADLRDTHLTLLRGIGGSANRVVAGGASSFIAPTRFRCRPSQPVSLRRNKTLCNVSHQYARRGSCR